MGCESPILDKSFFNAAEYDGDVGKKVLTIPQHKTQGPIINGDDEIRF